MPKSGTAIESTSVDAEVDHTRNVEFETQCVQFFSEVVQAFGIPRSFGMIYGLLFASPVPLRFTDIAARLDISRGSASQGLQALQTLGAVRVVQTSSANRELFEVELALRTLVSGVLREKVDPIVGGGTVRVRRLRNAADGEANPVQRKFYLGRVKQIETWRRQMGLLLPILKTILGSRHVG